MRPRPNAPRSILALLALAAAPAAAQPQPVWSPLFGGGDFADTTLQLDTFPVPADWGASIRAVLPVPGGLPDGTTALYVGGAFNFQGGARLNGIGLWDGQNWRSLGGGLALSNPPSPTSQPVVYDMVMFDDDGDGPRPPALYAAGGFDLAGGVAVHNIARWDGAAWEPVGGGLPAVSWPVFKLAVYDEDGDGPNPPALFAGGHFRLEPGGPAVNLARWDGQEWTAVGDAAPANLPVRDMAIIDPDGSGPQGKLLVVGGAANSPSFPGYLRAWNGTSYVELAASVNSGVQTLSVFDEDGDGPLPPSLIATGTFTNIDGVSATNIARWRGGAWSAVANRPTAMSRVVRATPFDADGDGPEPPVLVFASNLALTDNDGLPSRVFQWNGSRFTRTGGEPFQNGVGYAMAAYDADGDGPAPTRLVVGGWFYNTAAPQVNRIAVLREDDTWGRLGNTLGEPANAAIAFDEDGDGPMPAALFVGGRFRTVGEAPVRALVRFDGREWSAVGGGLAGATPAAIVSVSAMAIFDDDADGPRPPALYVAGAFHSAGGTPALNIARWDGAAWEPLGSGIPAISGNGAPVYNLVVFDEDGPGPAAPALYAAGRFNTAGGASAANIAKWDGTSWHPVAGGTSGNVYAMAVHDDSNGALPPALFIGGSFTEAGGVAASRIARLNGASWSPVGPGFTDGLNFDGTGSVNALASFDEDGPGGEPARLFAAGTFLVPGTTNVAGIARWDGLSWTPVGSGITDLPGERFRGTLSATSLAVIDGDADGPNPPVLVMAGNFRQVGGVSAASIARWDGSAWSPLGEGLRRAELDGVLEITDAAFPVYPSLATIDLDGDGPNAPALYATGRFSSAGGLSSVGIARWGPPEAFITRHPGDLAVASGQAATFTIAARGPEPITYQWRRDGEPLADGGPISGATTATLTIAPAALADRGIYDAVVTTPGFTATSAAAALDVLCAADWNGDTMVNSNDISGFLTSWLASVQNGDLVADFDGSGAVNSNDISAFLSAWLSAVGGGC